MRTKTAVVPLSLALAVLASAAFAQDTSPLARSKVGQWARYKLTNDMEMKHSVTKVDGKKVTVKTELSIKGKASPAVEQVYDLEKKKEASKKADAKTSEETLDIGGKKLKCKVLEEGNVKTWLCEEDVPVFGLVKKEVSGKVTEELVGWGDEEEKK